MHVYEISLWAGMCFTVFRYFWHNCICSRSQCRILSFGSDVNLGNSLSLLHLAMLRYLRLGKCSLLTPHHSSQAFMFLNFSDSSAGNTLHTLLSLLDAISPTSPKNSGPTSLTRGSDCTKMCLRDGRQPRGGSSSQLWQSFSSIEANLSKGSHSDHVGEKDPL